MDNLQNIRSRKPLDARSTETFRTPVWAFEALRNYAPSWFTGAAMDPSAGDGRMLRVLRSAGNQSRMVVGDIRAEESPRWNDLQATTFVGDYLGFTLPEKVDFVITNPPFSIAQKFVEKALTEVTGAVFILQSVAFQGTAKRSEWLKNRSGICFVLNLPRRPKWEVDDSEKPPPSNVWDFAWFVFAPGFRGLPTMDWLL